MQKLNAKLSKRKPSRSGAYRGWMALGARSKICAPMLAPKVFRKQWRPVVILVWCSPG